MAEVIRAVPGALDITLWRGDVRPLRVLIKDADGEPLGLPETGWKAEIKSAYDATGTGVVLGEFTVDASEAAEGVLYLVPDGELTTTLARKTKYDVQHEDGPVTWLAGSLILDGQVTT